MTEDLTELCLRSSPADTSRRSRQRLMSKLWRRCGWRPVCGMTLRALLGSPCQLPKRSSLVCSALIARAAP